ncbi:hypothetical protein VQ326_002283 [Salmonella enterica]|nr:hypothetical protein [Salmonella enterica]EMD4608293.1 hypothetical protein [Salmonella enterica]
MTGNLALRSDGRAYFVIQNADGSARAYFYKDKNGDGVHINNGVDGGGDFVFGKNGTFHSPDYVYVGGSKMASDGNIYGTRWNANGAWLWDSIAEQFTARDNNINTRATWDWVNQHFVQDVRLAAPVEFSERGLTERVWGGVVTSWADYGGSNYHIKWRLLQKLINGQWLTVAYA